MGALSGFSARAKPNLHEQMERMLCTRNRPSASVSWARAVDPGSVARAHLRRQYAVASCVQAAVPEKPKLYYVGVARASDGGCPDKARWGKQFQGDLTPPQLSKSDEHFQKLGLEFVETTHGVVVSELNDLFQLVGFPRRDPAKLEIALQNTYALVWVRSTKQGRLAKVGQMVGFARATSDGVLAATIWDVSVLPAWQGIGLGRAMMERLICKLVKAGLPTIALFAEPEVVGLYERLGFVKDPEGIHGLAFLRGNRENQQGALSAVSAQ